MGPTQSNSSVKHSGVWSWALYDWANSAFATTVIAGFFPIFFKQFWSSDFSATQSTLQLGVGSAIASAVVLVLAPVLGAIADRSGGKKAFLFFFTALGVAGTAALFWVDQGQWLIAISLFMLASVGFFGGLTFYDGLIVEVSAPAKFDSASALGYALGYLGGGVLLAVNVLMTLKPEFFGLADKAAAVRWSFLSVAVWWALFSIPLFMRVRERAPAVPRVWRESVRLGMRELMGTIRDIRARRTILLFLVAYWLYIDGVNTIIRMAVDFGLSLGFADTSLITALLLVQFIGFPAAIVFGYLGEKWDTKKAIYLGLAVYLGVTVWGYFLEYVWQFYAMAAIIGLVQGGVQSLSRSYFARLIPENKSGEFFGFYNMMGKFAAMIGPLLVGLTAALTGSARLSILSVIILFIAGGAVLWFVREDEHKPVSAKIS